MSVFIALAVVIIGLAVVILTLATLRTRTTRDVDQQHSNLLIFQESLKSLKKEHLAGLLTSDQYDFQKAEIEKRTVEEVVYAEVGQMPKKPFLARWFAYSFIAGIPIAVVGIYLILGTPAAIFIDKDPQVKQIEEMVSQLEKKLKTDSTNIDGWMFLGRSYAAMNRLTEAKIAFLKAISLDPKNDQLLADLADLIAFKDKTISGEALEYLDSALQINPKNVKALALRGSAAFDQKNYAAAIKDWKLAVSILDPADKEFVTGLKNSIQEAQALLQQSAQAPAKSTAQQQLSGQIAVSAALQAKVSASDTVFIYARATNGPRIPVAVLRFKAQELPRTFELNDSQAMSPELTLSKFKDFTIFARISKSGNASPQPGDLVGELNNVPLGRKNIAIVINTIQPE